MVCVLVCMYVCMYVCICVGYVGYMCVYVGYVCIFIKLHITVQSGPVIRVILYHSH